MQDIVKRCLTGRSEMEVMGAHTKSDPCVDKTSSDLSSKNKKVLTRMVNESGICFLMGEISEHLE